MDNPDAATTTRIAVGCVTCEQKEDLRRCGACRAAMYCGQEHQAADYPIHKQYCKPVVKARKLYEEAEAALRRESPNIFTQDVGYFWGVYETRPYMRARLGYTEALAGLNTKQGVEQQLDHLLDMLRLCRGDNIGVRTIIPGLMLQLNMDQECYDFVKWWTLTSASGRYDWGDMSLPYLDIRDADVFEDAQYLCRNMRVQLTQGVAVTLLKIRLYLDLERLQKVTNTAAGSQVSREELQDMRAKAVLSPIIANNLEIMQSDDHSARMEGLLAQIRALFEAVENANKYFWTLMENPGPPPLPSMYSPGSLEEAQLAFRHSFEAWVQTPGALRFMVHEIMRRRYLYSVSLGS